jgi:isoleucyl-tRNA synthetase
VLVFTAEEAWTARFGEGESVHVQLFPEVPVEWLDGALASRWAAIRDVRREVTGAIEQMRGRGEIGSSLQARAVIGAGQAGLADVALWSEVCITSGAEVGTVSGAAVSPGTKCARCWKVLEEVGSVDAHPALCLRCADAVESGLVGQAAAAAAAA